MNEFDCAQGRRQRHGEDPGLCSSSKRNESQQPVPLLTNGKQFQVLGEIPITTPDNLSVRSKSGPLDPGDKHVGYLDTRQPVPVTIVDHQRILLHMGLGMWTGRKW